MIVNSITKSWPLSATSISTFRDRYSHTSSPGCSLGCDTNAEYSETITSLQVQGFDPGNVDVDVFQVFLQQLFVVVAFPRGQWLVAAFFPLWVPWPLLSSHSFSLLAKAPALVSSAARTIPAASSACWVHGCPAGLWQGWGHCRTAAFLSALAAVDVAAIATAALQVRSRCSVGSRLCPRNTNRAQVRVFPPL